MNFNYSYRALLITSLLVGGLVLLMYGFKLSKKIEAMGESYDIEILEEELMSEQEMENPLEPAKIKTHRAFNEAEKFISELENERENPSEEMNQKLSEIDKAIARANTKPVMAINDIDPIKKPFLAPKESNSNEKNSSNSFRLVDRDVLYFPNPIYTCDSSGTIVLQIEVSASGKVVKAIYNAIRSNTQNECLIDQAIQYAKEARFTAASQKPIQLGTITYHFPGQ